MNRLHQINRISYMLPVLRSTRTFSATAESSEKIQIPKRIHRGPTDILRALESTITRDPTAAHYKYADDPYLIPRSNLGKRTFALSKEAGRKAAYWIREQHADLFQHRDCEPPVEAFFPKMNYTETSSVTEEDLKTVIDNVLVTDAITVYKALRNSNQEISKETLSDLLELICFYNEEDALSEDLVEERWFRQSTNKEKTRKTWKDGQLAEELFITFEKPGAREYSAIIMGMVKYYQVDRAWHLYQEAQNNGLALNIDAHNGIIRIANFIKEDFTLRWTFITDILSNIQKAGIKPNLDTLNSLLEAVSAMSASPVHRQQALRIMKEFKSLKIEPSLASWYFLLITFCRDRDRGRGSTSYILNDIMSHLENKEFKIRHVKDTYFFVTAMDVCRNHLQDKELGIRVNNLLRFGNNYDLIGDSFKESIYYRHYFILMVQSMDIHEFMDKVYDDFVPHVYVPEPGVMGELINYVEMYNAIEYIPKLWSDMLIFDHTDRESLLHSVLGIIANSKLEARSPLIEQFANVAWSIWTKIEEQSPNRIKKLSFTGEMLGNIMIALLWNNDFEKASMAMNKLDKDVHEVVGVPKIEALSLYIDHCVNENSPLNAIQCLQYCHHSGFMEVKDFAIRVQNGLDLDANCRDKIERIIGDQSVSEKVN